MTFHKGLTVCRFTSTTARTVVCKNANGESEDAVHYWTPLPYEKDGISRTIFIQLTKTFCSNHQDDIDIFGHSSNIDVYPLYGFVMGNTGIISIASESVIPCARLGIQAFSRQ
ncbi:unnamed protein product [Albugo candida]|uniref:Uncharacterized protein n=1 Tax=Albugo candida TaxID=65357 RepID=A0A024FTD2_9STRA|nr:unnamed protein product [Albugo candida]|eukprot:CCI10358.1 unnamed protein product [Albugo candida]